MESLCSLLVSVSFCLFVRFVGCLFGFGLLIETKVSRLCHRSKHHHFDTFNQHATSGVAVMRNYPFALRWFAQIPLERRQNLSFKGANTIPRFFDLFFLGRESVSSFGGYECPKEAND